MDMPQFVFQRPVRIEWGDCDPAGIVFYPRYFAMFDASTAEMFRAALGEPKIAWTKRYGLVGFPMVDTRAKFTIPSKYGDDVVITSRVLEFRASSFDVEHVILKDGARAVEGFETRVMVMADAARPGGIRSAKIDAGIIAAFEKAA
jgi:4-hydroxybenzoyl-CoA thioesterase